MPNSPADRAVLFGTGVMVGLALGIPGGAWAVGELSNDRTPAASPATITEDDPRWDCTRMGDLVCGPTNAQGAYPGRYTPTGRMVQVWPVDVWGNDLAPGTFEWEPR